MTQRLQVPLDDAELAEIKRIARRHHMTVAAWVREALRAARRDEPAAVMQRRGVERIMSFDRSFDAIATLERVYQANGAFAAPVQARRSLHPQPNSKRLRTRTFTKQVRHQQELQPPNQRHSAQSRAGQVNSGLQAECVFLLRSHKSGAEHRSQRRAPSRLLIAPTGQY